MDPRYHAGCRRSMRKRGSSIHLAHQPWKARHHKPIEMGQPEAGPSDELVDWAVHVAADANALLQGIEPILPFRNPWVVAASVLQEHVLSAGFEHAANLPQRCCDVRDR